MKIYYIYDEAEHSRLNNAKKDYTPSYFPALIAHMGVTAYPISWDGAAQLSEEDILLVGSGKIKSLPRSRVIILGTEKMPSRSHKIFAHYEIKDASLPLFVPLAAPRSGGKTLALAKDADGNSIPALVGDGRVFEFCFDLPATVWFSGDGYYPEEKPSYFYIERTPDMRPLPDGESSALPFNDLLIGELEKILTELGAPMIYKLMPKENKTAPDAVIHFSGDDDCASLVFNLQATMAMESFGFPYHINAMPSNGKFVFDKAVLKEIYAHGGEIALHTNFIGQPYSQETIKVQAELFTENFGQLPQTNVNHCLIQGGSNAEMLRWFSSAGIIADNGKLGEFDKTNINKFDLCGFGYGTSFPRYTCDDAEHKNELLNTMEIPLTYYEARLYTEDDDTSTVKNYLDGAVDGGRITQFFFHPHYLHDNSNDREATHRVLSLIKSYTKSRGYDIHYSSTNRIASFWAARRDARLSADDGKISVKCDTPLLLRLPKGSKSESVLIDGKAEKTQRKRLYGEEILLVYVPAGAHTVTIR